MKNKKSSLYIILTVIISLTCIASLSYAYFTGTISQSDLNVVVSLPGSYTFESTGNEEIDLTVSITNMLESSVNNVVLNTSTSYEVQLTSDVGATICAYDIYFIWDSSDKYTSADKTLSDNEFEFSISEENKPLKETDISSLSLSGNKVYLFSDSVLSNGSSVSNTYDFTFKMYNLDVDQVSITDKNLKGHIGVENVRCSMGSVQTVESTSGSSAVTLSSAIGYNTESLIISGNTTLSSNGDPSPTNIVTVSGVGAKHVGVNRHSDVSYDTYRELEYLQSSYTQYIDTGINNWNNTIEYEAKVSVEEQTSGIHTYFGAWNRWDSSGKTFPTMGSYSSFKLRDSFEAGTTGKADIGMKIGQTGIVYLKGDKVGWSEGTELSFNRGQDFINDKNIIIFATNKGGTIGEYASYKLYSFKLWLNGEKVRDFVPVKRVSDNALGLYDRVSKTFFENKGTGFFTGGKEVVKYSIPVVVNSSSYEVLTTSPLYKIGSYVDTVDVISGLVVRNVGVKVFTGTEALTWDSTTGSINFTLDGRPAQMNGNMSDVVCTHFKSLSEYNDLENNDNAFYFGRYESSSGSSFLKSSSFTSVSDWQTYFAQQYANGTPVTIYYPLASSIKDIFDETDINLITGNNIVTVTSSVTPSSIKISAY